MTEPLIRVFDCETSSLGDDAAVCEIGWTDVTHTDGAWRVGAPQSELVNPGQFIAPEASGIHHITDDMVKDCRPAQEALRGLARADVDVWCAHFARFDRQHFDPPGSQWICTYKAAVRQWPDAPNHKNQTLRYLLGLPITTSGLPHRARLDSCVTAHLLVRLLDHLTVDQLLAIETVPALVHRCNLKKHRGKTWEQVALVDAKYLEWYLGADDRDPDVEFTCRYWLGRVVDAREDRAPPPINPGDYLVNRNAQR